MRAVLTEGSRRAGGSRPAQVIDDMSLTRRDLLRAVPAAALLPSWDDLVAGAVRAAARVVAGGDDLALVVLELQGGNDGLGTLVPLDPGDGYARARPTLSQARRTALPVGGGYGLHASLEPLHQLLQRRHAAVVHGVGYPDPDRSHFLSRDIWHVADPEHRRTTAATTGWLGRAADLLAARGAAVPSVSVGSLEVPLCLHAQRVVVPSIERLADYELVVDPAGGRQNERREGVAEIVREAGHGASGAQAWINDVAVQALAQASRMREALQRYTPKADYPEGELGRHLQLLARMITSGFGTRLYHIGYGGFDTHAGQAAVQAGLLRQLAAALRALVDDLCAHGAFARTVILVHSEFGRRVAENRSLGTDHGAASCAFLLGEGLRAKVLGEAPSLTDLDDGDLRMTCDFRGLYAAVLRRIGVDPAAVLGAPFAGVDAFA